MARSDLNNRTGLPQNERRSVRLCGRSEGSLVRAEGLEPSRTLRSNGFSCHYGFRRPRLIAARFGVWTIPSPCPNVELCGGDRLPDEKDISGIVFNNHDCGPIWIGPAITQEL